MELGFAWHEIERLTLTQIKAMAAKQTDTPGTINLPRYERMMRRFSRK